jgi:hypothetical protein
MPIPFDKGVSVPSGVLLQELDGESVFLNLNNGQYFGLDEVGTHMWKALTTAPSVQAAYDGLLQEYEVDADQLRRDLDDLLEKLVTHGLVEMAHS